MKPTFIRDIRHALPDIIPFDYYTDRESAWLLARMLPAPVRLAKLKRGPLARLLARPAVQPALARAGGGVLDPADLSVLADPGAPTAVADADRAATDLGFAAERGLRTYRLSIAEWGDVSQKAWAWQQTTRPAPSLVLQVNFPVEHDMAFARHFHRSYSIRRFELVYDGHPVRTDGVFTMAWARIDADPWAEEILIEEIQADWFKFARDLIRFDAVAGHERHALERYMREVMRAYEADWARVTLLAALDFAVRELGVRRVWLHRWEEGARLKRIDEDDLPPRSIYTGLPKRFLFNETGEVPDMLCGDRLETIERLRDAGKPLFWVLDL